MAVHGLWLPKSAPWCGDLLRELMEFPSSKHDDCVDALGLIGQCLDHIIPGHRPETPARKPIWLLKEPQEINLELLWRDRDNKPVRRQRL